MPNPHRQPIRWTRRGLLVACVLGGCLGLPLGYLALPDLPEPVQPPCELNLCRLPVIHP